ncbi:MAG: hypothetical protein GTO45_07605 [Candidatus Aminicenantes bacterium]|nr:hypothetical protein [Candidatus Aminicenantes bacterium]NIM78701.1 hypothetical protein [Candidatus Aminicenantes bacterium]NIN17949.1 hypothetical protein [Candidatus Aminicenantes bacterium]NIN41852.1 hypothetical protein [Candidatus Aminicenantes bacterium]NIN84604.1 hypothetical protein [Candidatus Aminicenantes bacterium]
MKETKKTKKHISIHQLRTSELKAAKAGETITWGSSGDLCEKLTVVVGLAPPHENHKVVLA